MAGRLKVYAPSGCTLNAEQQAAILDVILRRHPTTAQIPEQLRERGVVADAAQVSTYIAGAYVLTGSGAGHMRAFRTLPGCSRLVLRAHGLGMSYPTSP